MTKKPLATVVDGIAICPFCTDEVSLEDAGNGDVRLAAHTMEGGAECPDSLLVVQPVGVED